jgi:rhodanese-related sulfurtransferase
MTHRLTSLPRRILFLMSLLLPGAGCGKRERPPVELEPPVVQLPETASLVAPAVARMMLEQEPRLQVIDCRMEEEYQQERLAGAYHLDALRPELVRQRAQGLDHNRPCLLYCAIGGRAPLVAVLLAEAGMRDIRVLEGGILAWRRAGIRFPPPPAP